MSSLAEGLSRLAIAAQQSDVRAYAAEALRIAAEVEAGGRLLLFEESNKRWTLLAGEASGTTYPAASALDSLRTTNAFAHWESFPSTSGSTHAVLVHGDASALSDDQRSTLRALSTTIALGLDRVRLQQHYDQTGLDVVLAELGQAITEMMDLPTVYRLAARVATQVARADDAFVMLRGEGPDGWALQLRGCLHPPAASSPQDGAHAQLQRASELGLKALRQHAVLEEQHENAAFAAVPMYLGDRPVGGLVCVRIARDGAKPQPFERLRLMRMRVVANYITIALQSVSLETEQKRRVRELLLLNEVARDCAKLGLDQLLPAVTERLCRSLSIDAVGMFFLDHAHDELVWGGGYSRIGVRPPSRTRFLVRKSGLAAKALHSREARRGGLDEIEVPELREFVSRNGFNHFAAIPLLVKDRVIGVISVAMKERVITDEELRLLVAISAEFAVAVDNALLYSEARHRAEDLSLVQNIGEAMAQSLEPSSVVHDTGMKLYEALECECVRLFTRNESTFTSVWQHGMPEAFASRTAIRTVDEPLAARALSSTSAVAFPASTLPESACSFYAELGYQQLMVAPMLVAEEEGGRQKVVNTGFIAVARRMNRPFTASEQHVLGAIATQLAVALKNARLFEQTKQRAEELSIIAEAGRALLGGTSLEEALSVVVERVARLVNVRGCHLMLVDPGTESLRFVAAYPMQRELDSMRISLRSDALVASAVRERKPQSNRDLAHHPRADTWPSTIAFQPEWALAIPILSGEQAMGVLLILESDKDRVLSQAEIDRVMAVGNQVAIAVERSRLHVRLEEAQAQLVRKERLAALGQLAAHVAHEVRNPLGVIVNSLGTLARFVELSGDSLRVYEMMKQEAGRLDRIVTDMLDYTRPTEPRLVPASLSRVLKDALASATAAERARNPGVDNIQTALSVSPDLPPIPMDDRLLHQALVNLLSNAFQSLGKSGKVDFSGYLSSDGRYAEICVEDNGPGIPAENKGRMFEPFFTTKAKGSGLGLAIVKRIVDDHNGEIIVDTEPGRGTRFIVRLPTMAALSSAVRQRRTNLSA